MIRPFYFFHLAITFLISSNSQHLFADSHSQDVSKSKQTDSTAAEYPTRTARSKSQYFVGLNYSHLDLLLPAKKGFHLGFVSSAEQTYEIEYISASIKVPFLIRNLGSFSETRWTILGRYYGQSNSFHLGFGINYNNMKLELGDAILSRMSASAIPNASLLEIATLGLTGSMGNRWQWDNGMTLGCDWISYSQPLFALTSESKVIDLISNENDKDKVNRVMKAMAYFPRLALLKINAGFSF